MDGPTTADLQSLVVQGNINGVITSAGHIGTIQSVKGAIEADITTLPGGWSGNLDNLSAATGISPIAGDSSWTIDVAGNLGSVTCSQSMGANPSQNGDSDDIEVGGTLGSLRVNAGGGTNGDLFTNINVGGNIGTVYVTGTLYGDIMGDGNAGSVTVKGSFGGDLTINNVLTQVGCLNVLGSVSQLSLPSGKNLIADLEEGGSIRVSPSPAGASWAT